MGTASESLGFAARSMLTLCEGRFGGDVELANISKVIGLSENRVERSEKRDQ